MIATALVCGIPKRKGGGSLLRNSSLAFGLPRGAKEGLEVLEGGSCPLLVMPDSSSLPSPADGSAVDHLLLTRMEIYQPSR